MRLYPAPGLRPRDPLTRALIPAEGVEVGPHDYHLHRMRQDGDLVETPPPAPEPDPALEPQAEAEAPAAPQAAPKAAEPAAAAAAPASALAAAQPAGKVAGAATV